MNRYPLTLVFVLWTSLALAFPPGFVEILGSGSVTVVADETFDATGYDLGASWTEFGSTALVDQDSTTRYHGATGQSLFVNQNLNAAENYTCYNFGSGASARVINLWVYIEEVVLPAINDSSLFLTLGNTTTSPGTTTGVVLYTTNISGVLKVYGRSATYGTYLNLADYTGRWVNVTINYVRNGTTTISIDGTSTDVTTADVDAQYLCVGGVGAFDADEKTIIYFDDIEGLL